MKKFPGPFRSPQMFKYKEKMAFTYNIQSVVHCRKFSMKQNVLHYCCLFSIWTTRKRVTFKDIFPGLSRTLRFNFQDFPGPKWFSRFSRTLQVLEFSRKKSGTFQEAWEPCEAVWFPSNVTHCCLTVIRCQMTWWSKSHHKCNSHLSD